MKKKDVLTTTDVAKICRVSTRVVAKWNDCGLLKGFTLPNSTHRRFTYNDVETFMDENNMPKQWYNEAVAEKTLLTSK